MALAPSLLLLNPHSFEVPSSTLYICVSISRGLEFMLFVRVSVIYLDNTVFTLFTAFVARLTFISDLSLSSTASYIPVDAPEGTVDTNV